MIGIDIVAVARIGKLVQKYPSFLERVFCPHEIEYIQSRKENIERIAGMFAAKEAMSKALGSGIGRNSFLDFQIFYDANRPYGICKGNQFALSISHERGYAVAVAQMKRENERKFQLREEFQKYFNCRENNTHKGDYGKLGIVAGSLGMTGAPVLASMAALRTGAGLVYNIVPKEILPILSVKLTEAVIRTFDSLAEEIKFLKTLDAVVLGPGMGTNKEKIEQTQEILSLEKTILVDADGITNLSKIMDKLKERTPYQTILTPHVGEFSKITGYSYHTIENNRREVAEEFAAREKVVLVLKGNRTVVTTGEETFVNDTGNPGMATAGSGDVLSGIIGALLCRMEPFTAAKIGVNLHGLAGDFAAKKMGQESLLARDIVRFISEVLRP